jgi:hypothetical protein
MSTIRERVSADPIMSELAHQGGIQLDNITALLNQQCQWTDIPQQMRAQEILDIVINSNVIMSVLIDAAAGEDVKDRCAALLSPEGLTVYAPGFLPPLVDRYQVAEEILNPNGTEKL